MVTHFHMNNVTIDVVNKLERLKRDLLCQASITTMAVKLLPVEVVHVTTEWIIQFPIGYLHQRS